MFFQRFAVLPLLLMACIACQEPTQKQAPPQAPTTAQEWIEASIAYHDPESNWDAYEVKIDNRAILDRDKDNPIESTLYLNNGRGEFTSTSMAQEHALTHFRSPDTVYTTWDHPSPTAEDSNRYRLDGSRVARIYNYHRYLQGLPMVLRDEGTIVQDSMFQVEIGGEAHQVVTVDYLPEGQEPTWQFYFRESDYALTQTRFYRYNAEKDTTTGEFIKFRDDSLVQGLRRYQTFVWEYLDESPLAIDYYTFMAP